MPHVVQFVNTISASPTIRLNLNDEATWACEVFDAPPPRLRRSVSANAMRDGVHVASSQYDARSLKLQLLLKAASQDALATQLQLLARELDRSDNYLKYQPQGATKPVFFRLYRSDFDSVREIPSSAALHQYKVDLLAEPFALGLMETIGPVTVNNDPAHATNPCHFNVSTIIGDVETPVILKTANHSPQTIIAVDRGSRANYRIQAEAYPPGTSDTVNPGGGPDAVMSGTGTNNFLRTNFPAINGQWTGAFGADLLIPPGGPFDEGDLGEWDVYAAVRRSDTTSVIDVGLEADFANLKPPAEYSTLPAITGRILVRLGRIVNNVLKAPRPGTVPFSQQFVVPVANRRSGAGTLDWDCLFLVPASRSTLIARSTEARAARLNGDPDVFDGYGEAAHCDGGNIPTAWYPIHESDLMEVSGSFPSFAPGVMNRVTWLTMSDLDGAMDKGATDTVTLYYWPRYLYIRPAAT